MYAGGVAAVAANNNSNLAAILTRPKIQNDDCNYVPLCSLVNANGVIETQLGRMLIGMNARHTPVSDYLFEQLREPLRGFLPRDDDYASAFDRFEYLLGLIYADINRWEREPGCWWGPVGRFAWRRRPSLEGSISQIIGAEIESANFNWPLLKEGLFAGTYERAATAKQYFDAFLNRLSFSP
jgi:hypothetical protein